MNNLFFHILERFPDLKLSLKYIMQFDLEQTIETER